MSTCLLRLSSGPTALDHGVVYAEGGRSMLLPFFPRSRHLPLPAAPLWDELMPPFVRGRRDEVLARIHAFCRQTGGIVPVEVERGALIGCIQYWEEEPYRLEYHGYPGNPVYTGEAEAIYEATRQQV